MSFCSEIHVLLSVYSHRGTRISAFYGQLLHSRPYASQYVLCVEDPYDDNDNTARTFGTWVRPLVGPSLRLQP